MRKTCRNCAKFGYPWFDKNREFPSCYPEPDWSYDLFPEDLLKNRAVPDGDCIWVKK